MNSKKAITLLVLTTLVLSMVPFIPMASAELTRKAIKIENQKTGSSWTYATETDTTAINAEKGHVIMITGPNDSVSSGATISIYWDSIKAWDGTAGLLNTTSAKKNGNYEVWFDMPQATKGGHSIWFTASDQETKIRVPINEISDTDLSASSGRPSDRVYVDLYGYGGSKSVAILLMDDGYPMSSWGSTTITDEDLDETYDADEPQYDGTVAHDVIEPGTFVMTLVGYSYDVTFTDDYDGYLYNATNWEVGTINYITGDWTLDFRGMDDNSLPEDGASFSADYIYITDVTNTIYVLLSSGATNSLGSYEEKRVTIPSGIADGPYQVYGLDARGNNAAAPFEVGPVITLSTDVGDVGDKVKVTGSGFTASTDVVIFLLRNDDFVKQCHIIDASATSPKDKTSSDGDLVCEIIIPSATRKDDDYSVGVFYEGNHDDPVADLMASTDFEITGLAEVTVDPDFGPQGSKITVSGKNFPNIGDALVNLTLESNAPLVEALIKEDIEIASDGSFEVEVRVPTENDGLYDLRCTAQVDDDGKFWLTDTVDFRVGSILVLISEDSAPVGMKIVLTGNGFTENGEWNATFGDVTIFDDESADADGLLRMAGDETPAFFVPQVQPGLYTITVWDVTAEIPVALDFTVTEYITLTLGAPTAPNKYNMTIEGWYWPEVDGDLNVIAEIDFLLYNATDDWDLDVRVTKDPGVTAVVNGTGFFEGWWKVPTSDELSKGSYKMNATLTTSNDEEYALSLDFVVGDVHKSIAPRKATFRIGETVTFNVEHSFGGQSSEQVYGGDIRVYDPSGAMYWDGDPLEKWAKVGMWYTLPTSSQMAGGNPMVLLDDAPLGTWTYKWREKDGDTILTGTFAVAAASESVLGQQIEDLNTAVTDLTSDISTVSTEMAGVRTQITNAINAANAAVQAANAATQAVNAVAQTASAASTAATNAAAAATEAKNAANGLTTLVYGAIGASLVAALAAIVSLMQISRRIAG
jgi:hypothetical protein